MPLEFLTQGGISQVTDFMYYLFIFMPTVLFDQTQIGVLDHLYG